MLRPKRFRRLDFELSRPGRAMIVERARCQVRCDGFNHGPTFYRNFLHEIGGPPPKSTLTKRKRAIGQSKAFFLVLPKAAASHPRRVVVEGGGARPGRKAALDTEPACPCREGEGLRGGREVGKGGGRGGWDPRDGARPRASQYGDELRQSRQPLDRRSLNRVRFTHVRRESARTRQRTSRTSEPRRGPTWARTGDPIQLSRVLNLLQEPNVVFGQAVCSSALPQQCEVPERWVAVVFIALGNVGHGLQRHAADVLGIQP